MPNTLFFELPEEKRERITEAAISEFACYGYENSSTNRIVRECGISKGSLFKYFGSKEDMYLYILDTVTAELAGHIENGMHELSGDIFRQITDYAAWEISWYIRNPEKGRLIVRAFTRSDTEIYRKIAMRYGADGEDMFRRLIGEAGGIGPERDRAKLADIIKWTMTGFNEQFRARVSSSDISFERLRDEYIHELSAYLEILRDCVK